jgi:hypothetical protein
MAVVNFGPDQIVASVSCALASFICNNIPLIGSDPTHLIDSPAAYDGSNENRILLYLYQIEFNPELRNTPATITAQQSPPTSLGTLVSAPPPLAVDLTYMLVVYGQSVQYEQMIAGSVAGLLDRCGRVPSDFISKPLEECGNGVLNVIPQPATIHMLRDLWAGFPNKAYHLTKLYTVSPVRLPAPSREPVEVVLQVDVHKPMLRNPPEVHA